MKNKWPVIALGLFLVVGIGGGGIALSRLIGNYSPVGQLVTQAQIAQAVPAQAGAA